MKNLRKNLKKNKKGFTLVEIIVVLVILAILAAAAIPTMLGFVEDSKGKAEIANARAAYVACQSIATEEYASGVDSTLPTTAHTISATGTTKLDKMLSKDMDGASVTPTLSNGKVTKSVFTNKGGKYTVTIDLTAGTTVVVKNTTPVIPAT